MATSTHSTVAAEVRAARARTRLTQADIATRVGMRQDTYSRKERGLTPFTIDEVFALADAFGVPAADLFPDA